MHKKKGEQREVNWMNLWLVRWETDGLPEDRQRYEFELVSHQHEVNATLLQEARRAVAFRRFGEDKEREFFIIGVQSKQSTRPLMVASEVQS